MARHIDKTLFRTLTRCCAVGLLALSFVAQGCGSDYEKSCDPATRTDCDCSLYEGDPDAPERCREAPSGQSTFGEARFGTGTFN